MVCKKAVAVTCTFHIAGIYLLKDRHCFLDPSRRLSINKYSGEPMRLFKEIYSVTAVSLTSGIFSHIIILIGIPFTSSYQAMCGYFSYLTSLSESVRGFSTRVLTSFSIIFRVSQRLIVMTSLFTDRVCPITNSGNVKSRQQFIREYFF